MFDNPKWIARILDTGGRGAATGIVVDCLHIITCGHLILDPHVNERRTVQSGDVVTVEFPFLQTVSRARVVFANFDDKGPNDLSVLEVLEAPEGMVAAPLQSEIPDFGQVVSIRGFSHQEVSISRIVSAVIAGSSRPGWLQLDGSGPGIDNGFGGGPVWDPIGGAVFGMIVAKDSNFGAQMATVDYLCKLWPPLAEQIKVAPLEDEGELEGADGRSTPSSTEKGTQEIPPAHHVNWVKDAPATADLLRRKTLSMVLVERLRQVHKESPESSFLMHIDGKWGSGKSTLLNLIDSETQGEFLVVRYNAWHHAKVDPPWWPLVTSLRDAVVDSYPKLPRIGIRACETFARVRYAGAPYFVTMILLLVLASLMIASLNIDWSVDSVNKMLSSSIAAVGIVGFVWTASRMSMRLLLWDSSRGARIFEQSHSDPIKEISHHFGWLVNRSKLPVVIFIDDLDRCEDSVVVDVLETVQTLVRDAPSRKRSSQVAAHFVVAADGNWIRCAYEKHYSEFDSVAEQPGKGLGYLFQEKLFQLSVPVSLLAARHQISYVDELLGVRAKEDLEINDSLGSTEARQRIDNASSEAEILVALQETDQKTREEVSSQAALRMVSSDILGSTKHILQGFAFLLAPNPRGIKQFINTYSILRTLRTLEGSAVAAEALAVWSIVLTQWPSLAAALEYNPSLAETIAGRAADPEKVPEEFRSLIGSTEFARFISKIPVALTVDLIRECTGISASTSE